MLLLLLLLLCCCCCCCCCSMLALYSTPATVDRSDFDAEEPDLAERSALIARAAVAERSGCAKLVKMLEQTVPAVLLAASEALFNLAILSENADALVSLNAMGRLHELCSHEDSAVTTGFVGVLMNCCASSSMARAELASQDLLTTLSDLLARAVESENLELAARALGAMGNLLLEERCAASARSCVPLLLRMMAESPGESETLVEDATTCLVRVARADHSACQLLVERGAVEAISKAMDSSQSEELQVRLCQLTSRLSEVISTVPEDMHCLGVTSKLLHLLSASAEEVQEGAVLALKYVSAHAPAAQACRREGAIDGIVTLFQSEEARLQTTGAFFAFTPPFAPS